MKEPGCDPMCTCLPTYVDPNLPNYLPPEGWERLGSSQGWPAVALEPASLIKVTTKATIPAPGDQVQQASAGWGAAGVSNPGEGANSCPASASGGSVPACKSPTWNWEALGAGASPWRGSRARAGKVLDPAKQQEPEL